MLLLQELLALRERHTESMVFKNLDLWQGNDSTMPGLSEADVEVQFVQEPASYSDHPYGEGKAREHHAGGVEVLAVKLVHDTPETDEDGNEVKLWKAGTNLLQQTWWKKRWTTWLEDKIAEF